MHGHFCQCAPSEKVGDPDEGNDDKEDGEEAFQKAGLPVESNGDEKEEGARKGPVELVLTGLRRITKPHLDDHGLMGW